jgi:hypothetical protein
LSYMNFFSVPSGFHCYLLLYSWHKLLEPFRSAFGVRIHPLGNVAGMNPTLICSNRYEVPEMRR